MLPLLRGLRVYARSAMGMPGSETVLEELTCRVLGIVAKIADELYCGGNTPEQLIHNWERVLDALQKSSLNLFQSKIIIAPSRAPILGWKWQLGTIHANKHRISTLSGCNPPKQFLRFAHLSAPSKFYLVPYKVHHSFSHHLMML